MIDVDESMSSETGRVLDNEQMVRAQYFVCHERHVFHRYCILRDSPAFPLLFMDRCFDWQFEITGDVPLVSRYNGFMELVCRESWVESNPSVGELADRIRRAQDVGSHVALPIALIHTDGTPYVTEWLIEAIDEDDTVYYTKTSPDPNFWALRKPVPFDTLVGNIAFAADGTVPMTEIRPSVTIEHVLGLSALEAFRAVYSAFGLRDYDGRVCRYVTPVVVSVDEFDRLIEAWEQRVDEIVSAGVVLFNDQSRLNKHIQNRLHPVQYHLLYLLGDEEVCSVLGADLVARVRQQIGLMDVALGNILKFSSLLVQQTTLPNFELYLKYFRRLRDTVAEYQRMIVDVQQALTA